jgi:hypothetical protein
MSHNEKEETMNEDRRKLLITGGLTAGALVASALPVAPAVAEEAMDMHAAPSADGEALSAATEDRCGTCQFWGGMRKISSDHKSVFAQSLGWCNNPKSPNYQKLTNATHQMTNAGIWTKWPALG